MGIFADFIARILPRISDLKINITYASSAEDYYVVKWADGALSIEANCFISAANGLYRYLKDVCRVNLSWNGNREILLNELKPFDGEIRHVIEQKHRVYFNYCTLNYSASWWDFKRWEQEIDFMALNGINMPLAVVGTEAVWFETLIEFGYSESEALKTISGPAFWAWQLMTNIEGYMPPRDKSYVYGRLELGRRILKRMLEFGMTPIQQGFSGHVPLSMAEKYPSARILKKRPWCGFKETAQLDPLDDLFKSFGLTYLKKQEKLLGNHGFYAADPFHENAPPEKSGRYLSAVGKAIFNMLNEYDEDAIWVMQAWSIRMKIASAVPKGRLLILDLNSQKYKKLRGFKGHDFVLGTLHNFGAKNAMQGRPFDYARNTFARVAKRRRNAVGTGLFMEGIEQNPFIYDLLFNMLTSAKDIDLADFTKDYIIRRYGRANESISRCYDVLLNTCYSKGKRDDTAIGSMLAARPDYLPKKASPWDSVKPYYDKTALRAAVKLMYEARGECGSVDGYRYDLVDITRQALSDEFYLGQNEFAESVGDPQRMRETADRQLGILDDIDELLGCRSELCLDRWLYDAESLAATDNERAEFELNARALITLWGDIERGSELFDYAWKEWNGLISSYYRVRWQKFYDEAIKACEHGERLETQDGKSSNGRPAWKANSFYKELSGFELNWVKERRPVMNRPSDKNPIPLVGRLIDKYWP